MPGCRGFRQAAVSCCPGVGDMLQRPGCLQRELARSRWSGTQFRDTRPGLVFGRLPPGQQHQAAQQAASRQTTEMIIQRESPAWHAAEAKPGNRAPRGNPGRTRVQVFVTASGNPAPAPPGAFTFVLNAVVGGHSMVLRRDGPGLLLPGEPRNARPSAPGRIGVPLADRPAVDHAPLTARRRRTQVSPRGQVADHRDHAVHLRG